MSADQLRLFTHELAQELGGELPDAATEAEKDSKPDDDLPPGSGAPAVAMKIKPARAAGGRCPRI